MTAWFDRFAQLTAEQMGKPWAFAASVMIVVIWGFTGPFFQYSEGWQLLINSATTVITFWMVFVIQNTQNRDSTAVQAKLDNLTQAVKGASNLLIQAEKKSPEELNQIRQDIIEDCPPESTY